MPEWFKTFSEYYPEALKVNLKDLKGLTDIIEACVDQKIKYDLYIRLCNNKFTKQMQKEVWFIPAINYAFGWFSALQKLK